MSSNLQIPFKDGRGHPYLYPQFLKGGKTPESTEPHKLQDQQNSGGSTAADGVRAPPMPCCRGADGGPCHAPHTKAEINKVEREMDKENNKDTLQGHPLLKHNFFLIFLTHESP